MISINEIMTSRLHTLGPTNSIQEAHDLMKAQRIRHVPVVEGENQLLGLVSQRDILAATSPQADRRAGEMSAQLQSIMSRSLDVISPDTSLIKAALLMRQKRHGCLPVMRHDKLVGIVTDTDFVTVAIHLLEQLEATEPLARDDEDVYEDNYADNDEESIVGGFENAR